MFATHCNTDFIAYLCNRFNKRAAVRQCDEITFNGRKDVSGNKELRPSRIGARVNALNQNVTKREVYQGYDAFMVHFFHVKICTFQ